LIRHHSKERNICGFRPLRKALGSQRAHGTSKVTANVKWRLPYHHKTTNDC